MGRNRKIGSAHSQLFTNLISVFYVYAKLETVSYQQSELDYLIYNEPIGYADLVLNGTPENYLKTVTEYKTVD